MIENPLVQYALRGQLWCIVVAIAAFVVVADAAAIVAARALAPAEKGEEEGGGGGKEEEPPQYTPQCVRGWGVGFMGLCSRTGAREH